MFSFCLTSCYLVYKAGESLFAKLDFDEFPTYAGQRSHVVAADLAALPRHCGVDCLGDPRVVPTCRHVRHPPSRSGRSRAGSFPP